MFLKYRTKMMVAITTIIFLVSVDRLLKYLAINDYFQNGLNLSGNIFKLNYAVNPNIAFSLPVKGWWLIILIIFIVLVLVYQSIYFFKKKQISKVAMLFLIIIGAISNLLDRIKYGYVIDYLDLQYFTIFNLADVMIVLGVMSLGWLLIKKKTAV